MIGFYHSSDLDGHASGAIVKLRYPECKMIGVNHSIQLSELKTIEEFEDLLNVEIHPGEKVYIVDFSFNPDIMHDLNNACELHWIDHHKTAVEWANGSFLASGGQLLEIGRGACELTWEYLYPSEETPLSIQLLSKYDVWKHDDPRVMPFQWVMRNFENTLPDNDDFWGTVIDDFDFIENTIETGQILLDFQAKQDAKVARGMAYEANFEGFRALVLNRPYSNSKVFDSVYDPDKHDIMVIIGEKAGEYKYTLYCDKPEIDVSKIAAKYGGGGHQGAAGFESVLPPNIVLTNDSDEKIKALVHHAEKLHETVVELTQDYALTQDMAMAFAQVFLPKE